MDAESLPLPNSAQEPTFLHYCEIYFCEAWYWRNLQRASMAKLSYLPTLLTASAGGRQGN